MVAAILAQKEFPVSFERTEATAKPGQMTFVFRVPDEKTFDDWYIKYINEQTSVEPRTYHAKIIILKDSLSHYKI